MTYEVTIRHTIPVVHGDGAIHSRYSKLVRAESEEQALERVALDGIWDGVDHIANVDHSDTGIEPFSVDTGHPEFASDTKGGDAIPYDPSEDLRIG